MKFIRGLYVWMMYVLAAPLMILGLFGLAVYGCVLYTRHHYDESDIKELFMAAAEGFKVGHAVNMHFVKYGRNGSCGFMEEAE